MRIASFIFIFALAIAVTVCAQAEDSLWESLSYEEACEKAEKESKYVFLDFYTEWCAPCKIMDKTTFTEERVIKLLKEKTIPLKIDADENRELAKQFRVMSFPTLVYTKADGTELGRISGFGGTDAFLESSREFLGGKDVLTLAREQLEAAGKDDPAARLEYGIRLRELGRLGEALEEYLWCWDLEEDKLWEFLHLRYTTLVSELTSLAIEYPPARKALTKRRNSARTILLRRELDEGLLEIDYTRLNEMLGEESDTLRTYDRLRERHPDWSQMDALREAVLDQLIAAKRYQEIDEQVDILEMIRARAERHHSTIQGILDGMPAGQADVLHEFILRRTTDDLVRYYQVLCGLQKTADAEKIAELILSIDDGANTYNNLAWQAFLSGSPTKANLQQARKADVLTNGEDGAIIDTLARILHKLGHEDEACDLLRERVMGATVKENSQILEETIYDLGCKLKE